VKLEIFVKIVDFEEDLYTIEVERSEVILAVRVIGSAEIVIDCNCLY